MNEDIFAIAKNCPKLRQLDILGSSIVQPDAIERILQNCLSIEFIDLSFCSRISAETIETWCSQYKNCFKRSYTPITIDDIYTEFP